jgi:two-component system chemotaxis response regulator CheB
MQPARNLPARNGRPEPLSVVCFGASAGGLDAYRTILSNLPSDTGLAFIIVHHQPAEGKSLLTEILPNVTKMPVVLIADGEVVKANHVYVVPPGQQVSMDGDHFHIAPIAKMAGWPKNISVFLQSLADDRKKRAIAVILSGFDSDGAAALQSIKDEGGIVIAQDFQTAKQPDMPKSAVRTGCVDYLLSPPEIAGELVRIAAERGHIPVANLAPPKGAVPNN